MAKEADKIDLDKSKSVADMLSKNISAVEYLAKMLVDNNLTISTAESITGGTIAKCFTEFAGASKWFKSGIVCYSDEVKINELQVDEKVIKEQSAVSLECAKQMAVGAQKKFKSDIAVATTGYAGPTGDDVGLVYVALKYKDKEPLGFMDKFTNENRNDIREMTALMIVMYTIALVGDYCEQEKKS